MIAPEVPVQESRGEGRSEEADAFNLGDLVNEEVGTALGEDPAADCLVLLYGPVAIKRACRHS